MFMFSRMKVEKKGVSWENWPAIIWTSSSRLPPAISPRASIFQRHSQVLFLYSHGTHLASTLYRSWGSDASFLRVRRLNRTVLFCNLPFAVCVFTAGSPFRSANSLCRCLLSPRRRLTTARTPSFPTLLPSAAAPMLLRRNAMPPPLPPMPPRPSHTAHRC